MVVLFWLLTRQVWDDQVADRATVLLCFFPGAFIFSLLYSEPVLLTFGLLCLIALRKRWWLIAGLAAAVATASRPTGVALVACCAWEAFFAVRSRREWRSLIAPILSPLGIIGYFGFVWWRTGSITAWTRTQEGGWGERIQPFAIWHYIQDQVHHPLTNLNTLVPLIGTAFVIVTLVLLIRAGVPSVLIVYTVAVVVISLMSKTLGLRPRFVMTAFPLIMVLGYRLRNLGYSLVLSSSAVLLSAVTIISVTSLLLTP
jgi:hypothetical protein